MGAQTFLDTAFSKVSKYEDIRILEKIPKYLSSYESDKVWQWTKEIESPNGILILKFNIVFKEDTPISIPKFYISEDDYDKVKYLPHIDFSKYICLYNSEALVKKFPDPEVFVFRIMRRCIKVIKEGLWKENYHDFKAEFLTYWLNTYDDEKVPENLLYWRDGNEQYDNNLFYLISLDRKINTHKHVLVKGRIPNSLQQYLDAMYIKVIGKQKVYYLGDCIDDDICPPWDIKIRDVLKSMRDLSHETYQEFLEYLDSVRLPYALFKIKVDNKEHYLGFSFYVDVKKRPKDTRIKLSTILSKYQSSKKIRRICLEEVNQNRFFERTSGVIPDSKKTFCFVGLGSIGANMLILMDTFDSPNLILVDDDNLAWENIQRHFLPYSYTGFKKVKGLSSFFTRKNPFRSIQAIDKDIRQIKSNNMAYADYIFCCTGSKSAESYLEKLHIQKQIKVPIFYIWVEPFLSAGHCLYIPPNSIKYSDFFDSDNLFLYNCIDKQEYISNNESLSLKETGCSSNYVPYSSKNTFLFLSAIFPLVDKIINDKEDTTRCFSWLGNIKEAKKKNIKLMKWTENYETGHIQHWK